MIKDLKVTQNIFSDEAQDIFFSSMNEQMKWVR